MESKLGSNFDPNDENYIENNLLKMDIFYKEFNFENIVEIPAYPVSVLSKYMFFSLAVEYEFQLTKMDPRDALHAACALCCRQRCTLSVISCMVQLIG